MSLITLLAVILFAALLLTLVKLALTHEQLRKKDFLTKTLSQTIAELKDSEQKRLTSLRPIATSVLWDKVSKLDLTDLEKVLLVTYPDWGQERTKKALLGYLKFLYLFGLQKPNMQGCYVIPLQKDIDCAWKTHILMVKRYQDVCHHLFNELLVRDESQAAILGYGEGNTYTKELYGRHFLIPRNTPLTIQIDHKQTNEGEPWLIWWEAYRTAHPSQVENHHYNRVHHLFETSIKASDKEKRSTFFSDHDDEE